MRAPTVAGLRAGAGTSTLAAALHAIDAGTDLTGADIVVCRDDAGSLAALAACRLTAGTIVAVLAEPADPTGTRARMSASIAGLGPVTVLPHVAALVEPGRERVAALLGRPAHLLDTDLRSYADAVRRLATAVISGGGLTTGALTTGAQFRRLWPGLGPLERRVQPVAPRPTTAGHDLDDAALESLLLPAAG